MIAKEKAKELVDKFQGRKKGKRYLRMTLNDAKQCALICVDEMSNELRNSIELPQETPKKVYDRINYLHEIKQEIEKI